MLTIILKKFNIISKNYIHKDINIKLINKYNYINTKFAPEPNGFIHLGNFKSFYINLIISKIYNGLNLIKLDDTNPIKEKILYKNSILKVLKYYKKNCKNNFIKIINYSSFFFTRILQLSKLFFKKKIIINKYNINFTLKGFYKEKENYIKLFIKKSIYKIYRIKYKKHYKLNYNFHIYNMYNYINILSDKFLNIKYSLCSVEFKKYNKFFKWFNSKIFIKNKIYQKEFDKINFKNNLTKKKKIFFLKEKKFIKNYKDLRLLNFKTLKITNKNINNLFNLFERLNLNKNIRNLELNLLNKKFLNFKIFHLSIKIILFKNKFKNYIYINYNNLKKNLKIKKYISILNFIIKLHSIKKIKKNIIINYKLLKSCKKNINITKKYNKILLNIVKYYNIIKKIKYNTKSKKIYKSYKSFYRLKKNLIINNIKKYLYIKISALHDLNV